MLLSHVTEDHLKAVLRIGRAELFRMAERSSHLYHRKLVRRGSKERILRIPHPRMMRVLRLLHKDILRHCITPPQAHPNAGCCPRRGPKWVASRHARHPFVFQLDIQDFYPSVQPNDITASLLRLGMPGDAAQLVTLLTTCDGQLPQGAPTSTALGEIVLFPLDSRLAGFARSKGVTYSRYVDDITLSGGERTIGTVARSVESIIADQGWIVNPAKVHRTGPSERHSVLGIVVNHEITVAREYYAEIFRLLTFLIKRRIFLSARDERVIRGKISWVATIDASRGARLQALLSEYEAQLAAQTVLNSAS